DEADAGAPSPDDVLERGQLALREPQVQSAQIGLQSARSGLARAQLQLSRTGIAAPFNALVQAEAAEVGQLVGPASQLATLVGTDVYWVQVSMPLDQLAYVDLPQGERLGSPAKVWLRAGGHRVEREGRIVRLLGDLDPVGRMARVLVEIEDPLGSETERPKRTSAAGAQPDKPTAEVAAAEDATGNGETSLPLLLGSFVHVEIRGKTIENVAEIPTRALQSDDRVFLISDADKLEIRPVEVLIREAQTTVVRGRLSSGERLIVSTIGAAVQGMDLRVLAPAGPAAASASATAQAGAAVTAAPTGPPSAAPEAKQ
ncbi:MAG: HlyD family efflux transporter periplasmic adaptor subunit, partial [Deltaproteobacteria bacterium]|nr:HlyD family efflux transporter periplasmic adaptor subunit [Deltaproteobacteria bacterium]MBW2532981.1 HlyD family efflux transporter periplasmic adaptor subunit [Deltaproteobacteria bacterium]